MPLIGRLWAAFRGAPLPYAPPTHSRYDGFFDPRTRTWFGVSTGEVQTKLLTTKPEQLNSYSGWAYAAASIIAQDIRANPWSIYEKSGEDEWTPISEDRVPPILERPNYDQSWGDFIETTCLHLDLTGEFFWNLITYGASGGKLAGLQCIVPSWIECPVFDETRTKLTGWRVNVPGANATTVFSSDDVVFGRYPHPCEPFRGASPVEAFALSHEMDTYARGYGVALLKNRAQPDGVLSSDQELTHEQAELAEERWRDKVSIPGRTPVIGRGIKYMPTASSLNDLQFSNFANISRDQIFAIYKVPASKVGLVQDSNRANSAAADATYKENAILPRLRRIEEKINLYIMPRLFGDRAAQNLYFEFDSPVDEDADFVLQQAQSLFKDGVSTINEYRESQGLPTLPGDEGNLYYLPVGVKPVSDLMQAADQAVAAAELALNPPEPAPQGGDSAPPSADQPKDGAGTQTKAPGFVDVVMAAQTMHRNMRRALVEAKFLRSQERLENAMKSTIRKRFSVEQRILLDRYRQINGERILPITTQQRGWLEDALSETSGDWEDDISEFVQKSIKEGWLLGADDLNDTLDFTLFEEVARSYAKQLSATKVQAIQQFTRDQVRKIIENAIEAGLSVDDTANRLRQTYDGFKGVRAETIARTETASAVNYGKLSHATEAEQELGLVVTKEWLATQDDRTRETHAAADGETVALQEKFQVGSDYLDHPGDPAGSAAEIVNCRCTIVTSAE